MNTARPTVTPARHRTPKHRVLRLVPDLHQDTSDPTHSKAVETPDLQVMPVPPVAVPDGLAEAARYAETIRLLEHSCDDLQGRLLVLRGQTNALTEENIGLRADLYNLMHAVETDLRVAASSGGPARSIRSAAIALPPVVAPAVRGTGPRG